MLDFLQNYLVVTKKVRTFATVKQNLELRA